MSPARKRTVRLVAALSAAVVLASALVYTTFSAANPTVTPGRLLREALPGRSYQLTGKVEQGSVRHEDGILYFDVQERTGGQAVALSYTGTVPDPFKEGREVIVTVEKQGERFVGERDSLITKCPSKYQVAPSKHSTY